MKKSVMSQSLEQSFKKIQYMIHSVSFGEVPSQAVEIELQGGVMKLDKTQPEFIIAFLNDTKNSPSQLYCEDIANSKAYCLNLSTGQIYSNTNCYGLYDKPGCIVNRTVGRLVYEYRDWMLTLEGGAVFSKYTTQDYSKLLFEPRILYNASTYPGTFFIVMTTPYLTGNLSASGMGKFRFIINEGSSSLSHIRIQDIADNFTDIYILIRDTENKRAWCKFFEKNGDYFNTTLNASETRYPSCYSSSNVEVTIKEEIFQTASEIIVIFREVRFG